MLILSPFKNMNVILYFIIAKIIEIYNMLYIIILKCYVY